MKAEEMFRDYRNLKKEQSVLEFQLQQFQGINENDLISAMSLSHPDGDERVQTSSLSDKTAKVAINYKQVAERENDEWYDFLWNRYRYVKEEVDFFEQGILGLKGVLPEVMKDLLNEDLTWDDIQARHHVSRTMVSKYKKSAMKELNVLYELRDRQTESYILS